MGELCGPDYLSKIGDFIHATPREVGNTWLWRHLSHITGRRVQQWIYGNIFSALQASARRSRQEDNLT